MPRTQKITTMRLYTTVIAFAFMAILTSCKSKDAVASEDKSAQETMVEETNKLEISKDYSAKLVDAIAITSTAIEGNNLLISVSYSGGCETHDFKLMSNGAIMKSMPPQMNITLEHNGNGDSCRAMIEQTLVYDISEAKSYASGTIILILNGDRENRIEYNYQ